MEPLPVRFLAPVLAATALAGTLPAQVTTRASVASDGSQFLEQSQAPSISADGRRIAFVKGVYIDDTHSVFDVFVRDPIAGTTVLVSATPSGAPGNANSGSPRISAEGRFVAFTSLASDLVAGDSNGMQDVFVRDLETGAIERANLVPAGGESAGPAYHPSISGDGRFVAFWSGASDLVAGDWNAHSDVFVRDRIAGATERVSAPPIAGESDGDSDSPSISRDGRWVVFGSGATNLVLHDLNGRRDAFVADRRLHTVELASAGTGWVQSDEISFPGSISDDGRYVTFMTAAANLVPGDGNGTVDAFVRDRWNATTECVSVDASGAVGNSVSFATSISADGRFVALYGMASNLVPGDTNGWDDVFVHDRRTGGCERVSVGTTGLEGDGASMACDLSADGRWVAFASLATNLVAGDTNGKFDVFVRDRAAMGFTSVCDPGSDGVMTCPCGNQPPGPGRGCNNSAGTGGARLTASGVAYLSMDSLVFATSGERATALSIVLQGDIELDSGTAFGQGVRCFTGTMKRLYVKVASGGSITAPDAGAGELPVSVRSASLGDPIAPGATRSYLVYYRDPVVMGGCPVESTFNATQGGRVEWWP
jgi:Tol biopolymer transport system component